MQPKLSGFIYAINPDTLGSSPKHIVYAFIMYGPICAIFVFTMWEEQKDIEFVMYLSLQCEKNEKKIPMILVLFNCCN